MSGWRTSDARSPWKFALGLQPCPGERDEFRRPYSLRKKNRAHCRAKKKSRKDKREKEKTANGKTERLETDTSPGNTKTNVEVTEVGGVPVANRRPQPQRIEVVERAAPKDTKLTRDVRCRQPCELLNVPRIAPFKHVSRHFH